MQGFNMGRYYPPSDSAPPNINKLHNRRAPGTLRADGTQTVRFELPFAVWCHTCQPYALLGQGVRFNAVKTRVGAYHSTPIWDFRLKHGACGGLIHVRTDPQNTAYVVVSGGAARDYGGNGDEVREGEGGLPILTEAERERRREDAFAAVEGKVEEKEVAGKLGQRIEELYGARKRDWEDTYEANRRVRAGLRRERKERKREVEATEKLKERLGTDMEPLPETEEDVRRARLVVFEREKKPEADAKPFWKTGRGSAATSSKGERVEKDSRKAVLQRQLVGNTRAALNPFG